MLIKRLINKNNPIIPHFWEPVIWKEVSMCQFISLLEGERQDWQAAVLVISWSWIGCRTYGVFRFGVSVF
ncbi:hypothetical protein BSG1_13581 [Bacillus sp. SG-1]|nr:hypothetical protein BSG1_13581 [Bacillus sp. SG-1]